MLSTNQKVRTILEIPSHNQNVGTTLLSQLFLNRKKDPPRFLKKSKFTILSQIWYQFDFDRVKGLSTAKYLINPNNFKL